MSRHAKSDRENLWTSFKNEFRIENFSLNFETNSQSLKKEPEVVLAYFHTTMWPCCNKLVYLIYRIAIAIYYTFWFVESIIRNAEFISKDIKIKNKINIFSIHPWPLYMTSWSLTILFAHLWISAFISLYFYSINEKSCLASIFMQLFGPFSCSRIPQQKSNQKTWFNGRRVRSLFISKTTISENPAEKNKTKLCVSNLSRSEICDTTTKIGLINSPAKTGRNETLADPEMSNQIVFLPEDQLQDPIVVTNSQTYCDIPVYHLCNVPSSVVTLNAESWKHWIKIHVPSFILILIKIDWLIFNLVAISALIVTSMYFGYTLVFDLDAEPTWIHELGNVHRHGINSVVALIDVIMLGFPIRVLHFVYVIIYGWVYAFVTFLYWLQNPNDHVIYDQINYKNPGKMIVGYFLLTMVVFIMQIAHFLAYRFKVMLRDKYCKKCDCFTVQEMASSSSENSGVNIAANDVVIINETCKV